MAKFEGNMVDVTNGDSDDEDVELRDGGTVVVDVHGSIPTPARVSVFDRLSDKPTVERLNFKPGEISRLQFAAVVGGKNADLQFFPPIDKSQTQINFPIELAKSAAKSYNTTLYGYFLGPRLHFPIVKRFAQNAWGKFGFADAMMNANGFYFFKFNDEGGANQVVESGPIMIRGVPFFVFPWNPTKGISRLEHTTCPLWVKLHNIPLVAFNKEGISRIASVLGVPKQMDACTTNMCDKAWGRPGFTKVLVEVWAVGELKRNLELVIPSLTGEDDVKVTIGVEYMWEPSQCSHCLMFGHKVGSCVKAKVAKMATKIIKKAPVADEDGFELVQRKQWKPKANRSHVEGDQLNSTNSDSSPTDHQDVGVTTNDRADLMIH